MDIFLLLEWKILSSVVVFLNFYKSINIAYSYLYYIDCNVFS